MTKKKNDKVEEIEIEVDNDISEEATEKLDEIDKPDKSKAKPDEDLNTKYVRLMADFQNYKRRTEQQKSEIHAYANEKIVLKLIEVIDNFERALETDSEDIENFKGGMELIFKQLKEVLMNVGVEEIITNEVSFDPNFHNAVMMEDTDVVESGMISEVLQKGYTLNGKVVRPSMVKVAN